MLLKKWVVGPFQCNCRLYVCSKTGEGVLVDPGDEAPRILKDLQKISEERARNFPDRPPLRVKAVFHTHGHLDHIAGSRDLAESAQPEVNGIKLWLHAGDQMIYDNLVMQGQMFGLNYRSPRRLDSFFEDGQLLSIGKLRFEVLYTPGHSPGSVSLRLQEDRSLQVSESVLTGDTLFKESVGRTDLWGGNGDQMFSSIRRRLLVLDDDTCVCPGHGEDTTIGKEKRQNPFL